MELNRSRLAPDALDNDLPPDPLIAIYEGFPAFYVDMDLTPLEAVSILLDAALWVAEDPSELAEHGDVPLAVYGALLEARRELARATGDTERDTQ
jgi:hypothetical protein